MKVKICWLCINALFQHYEIHCNEFSFLTNLIVSQIRKNFKFDRWGAFKPRKLNDPDIPDEISLVKTRRRKLNIAILIYREIPGSGNWSAAKFRRCWWNMSLVRSVYVSKKYENVFALSYLKVLNKYIMQNRNRKYSIFAKKTEWNFF